MLVHNVLFWLKEDLSEEDRKAFKAGLETLKTIPCHGPVITGTVADTEKRPVVEHSYDFGLTCIFTDKEEHDVYQIHDTHQAFIKGCAKYWDKVMVTDYD